MKRLFEDVVDVEAEPDDETQFLIQQLSLMARQKHRVEQDLKKRLKEVYYNRLDEKIRDYTDAIALLTSNMHKFRQRLAEKNVHQSTSFDDDETDDDEPDLTVTQKRRKQAEQVLFMYKTTGILIRMSSKFHDDDSLRFDAGGVGVNLSATFIRKGLSIPTYPFSGATYGFLYDPDKLKIAGAFPEDAFTHKTEKEYSQPNLRKGKYVRKYKIYKDKKDVFKTTDYAKPYSTTKFGRGRERWKTWDVDFPPETVAGISYKTSKTLDQVMNEVMITAKPGRTLADAIIAIVSVKGGPPLPKYHHRAVERIVGHRLPFFEYSSKEEGNLKYFENGELVATGGRRPRSRSRGSRKI